MNGHQSSAQIAKEPWQGLTHSPTKAAALKALWELLKEDAADCDVALAAFHQIVEVLGDYEASTLMRRNPVTDVAHPSRNISETRRELTAITDAVKLAHSLIQNSSLDARRLLSGTTRASLKNLDRLLVPLIKAARRASKKAESTVGRPADHSRAILARDIAQITRDTLKRRPSSSRPVPDTGHARGGALYGRLLVAALKVVNVRVESIGKPIDAGLRLLDHPERERGDSVDEL
jgi:hypothetical protein